MKKVVIVLPTYNEKENIEPILTAIMQQQAKVADYHLHVLVVDDNSPDGTGEIVRSIADINPPIHYINGQKKGLGAAYIRGFTYAINHLKADVVFEMDADFSHNPNYIPFFLQLLDNNYDMVIGSRYVPGGSIPQNWSPLRKANSKWGNIFARHIGGLKTIQDCTSGFRAIKTDPLKKIRLNKLGVKGYAFQISLLHALRKANIKIAEFPIRFRDRKYGQSKIQLKDITEFVNCVFLLRFPFLQHTKFFMSFFFLGFIVGLLILLRNYLPVFAPRDLFITSTIIFSTIMIIQVSLTIYWMIYAWEDPEKIAKNKSPEIFDKPKLSFTALIPARHEQQVIGDTIRTIANIDYPDELKEIIVICKTDDDETIKTAYQTINSLGKDNIRLVAFSDTPINKPHSLNFGLAHATKDVVVIFDAEDEPHKDIYQIVNTIMKRDHADVVQSGVQLMNYRSQWFSTLNVLEYFFWFKSALHWFANIGAVPLGGNTVFFKRKYLSMLGGWNEDYLTEDADIGIRLSLAGAKIKIVYDEKHVTREETPATLSSFIKQRTRWNQGFLQVLMAGDWMQFKNKKQKLLTFYILFWPEAQALLFFYLPIAITISILEKLPVIIVLLTMIPVCLLVLQLIVYLIGLYEFIKDYRLKMPVLLFIKVLFFFLPYQLILSISAVRGVFRHIINKTSWEKTTHINAHREEMPTRNLLSYQR